jgi:peptide/nickel transport system substrate-binding protein
MGGDTYKESVVVDDYTIKVIFNEPYAAFIASLSDGALGIDSPTAIEEYGDEYGVTALVGTGPFMFKEWVAADHMTFVRNPDYNWAPELFKHSGPAYLEEYVCRELPEAATLSAALEIGEVDLARVGWQDVGNFRAIGGFTDKLIPKAGTTRMFFMNTQKWPTSELIFRQAVIHAIDNQAIIDTPYFSGIGNPGASPLPRNMVPGGIGEFEQIYEKYDPEKSMALLDEFGCVDTDGDGLREKDGESCKVVFILHPNELGFVQPAEGMLRAVGIDVELLQGDWPVNMEGALRGDHNLYLISDSGFIAQNMIWGFFHSEASYNVSHYSSDELDMHLDAGLTTMNEAEKWEHTKEAIRIIMADAVTVNAVEIMYPFVMDDKVQDVFYGELGYPIAYDIWFQD